LDLADKRTSEDKLPGSQVSRPPQQARDARTTRKTRRARRRVGAPTSWDVPHARHSGLASP